MYMCALDRDQQSELTNLVYRSSSVGIVVVVGAAAGILRQRRRLRICTAPSDGKDDDAVDASFVEMSDKGEISAV